MTERWFSEPELSEMSRPTMDRAIEAIDAGELDRARELCAAMRHEWQMLHDLMAGAVLDLVSYIQQQGGDDAVADAWRSGMERGWRRHHDAIGQVDRRRVVELLAATWRAHRVLASARTPAPSRSSRTRRRSRSSSDRAVRASASC